jgi:hypothetical protein
MHPIYRAGVLLLLSDRILYIQPAHTYTEFLEACYTIHAFFPSTECHVFHNVIIFCSKYRLFKVMLKFPCPNYCQNLSCPGAEVPWWDVHVAGWKNGLPHILAAFTTESVSGWFPFWMWGWRPFTLCVQIISQFFSGWNSAAGIAPCCGLDGLGIKSHWQDFVHMSRLILGPTQPRVQWVPGFFPGIKEPWYGIDHPRLKKEWTYISTFPLGFMACYRMSLPYPSFSVSSVSIASPAPLYVGCVCRKLWHLPSV